MTPCPSCIFGPMIMPFGKNAGKRILDLSEDYLKWLAMQGWAEIIRAELHCLKNHQNRVKYYDIASR